MLRFLFYCNAEYLVASVDEALIKLWRPHRDSNPEQRLRRPQFYPVKL